MTIDFFDRKCQEPSLNAASFGICDDGNGSKAYIKKDSPESWTAAVSNEGQIDLTFTAIDNCILNNSEYKRCDGMLTSERHILFIELKNQKSAWIADAFEQIESTVQLFIANHNIQKYKHKKAFICNKSHKRFQEIDNERSLRFFQKYRVRIDAQATIIIV